MVVIARLSEVVLVCAPAVARQYAIEIEHRYVLVWVIRQPFTHEPVCNSARISRLSGGRGFLRERRRDDEHEQLVLMSSEVGQDIVVYPLDVGDGLGITTAA